MDINKGRDRKNTMRKIRNLRRRDYMELSIDDKIALFELEEDLEGNKKTCTYYESKGEKRHRAKKRRERSRK